MMGRQEVPAQLLYLFDLNSSLDGDALGDALRPTTGLLTDGRFACRPPIARRRLIAGFSEVFIESAFAEVIPYSSASIIAFKDHLTISSHTESPCLTTGPNGSLEIVSGNTMCSSGLLILVL